MTKPTITDSLLAHLKARPGQRFTAVELSEAIGSVPETVRKMLKPLVDDCLIIKRRQGQTNTFWVPAGELVPARLVEMPARPYRLPSDMAERVRDLQSHRERFPSRHL